MVEEGSGMAGGGMNELVGSAGEPCEAGGAQESSDQVVSGDVDVVEDVGFGGAEAPKGHKLRERR